MSQFIMIPRLLVVFTRQLERNNQLVRASNRSRKKKSNFTGLLGINLQKNWPILREFSVSSFSQHNLRLVVSRRYLHVSMTKFQDKFASLWQVKTPHS